jgi:hypothetical protein
MAFLENPAPQFKNGTLEKMGTMNSKLSEVRGRKCLDIFQFLFECDLLIAAISETQLDVSLSRK